MKAKTYTVDLGRSNTEIITNVSGYPVRSPKYTDETEQRVTTPGHITITRMAVGYVLRLDGKPLVSLNSSDLAALGVALIKADAR